MADDAEKGIYRLDLPAEPSSLSTARLFASAVARTARVPDDTIEDIKLLVSEALTAIITGGQQERMSLALDPSSRTITFWPVDEGQLAESSDEGSVIAALAQSANREIEERRFAVTYRDWADERRA